MKPCKPYRNDKTFGPPDGWNERNPDLQLPAIDVMRVEVGGKDVFVSRWKPTDHEIGCLLRGGLVQLACVGGQLGASLVVVEPEQGGILLKKG